MCSFRQEFNLTFLFSPDLVQNQSPRNRWWVKLKWKNLDLNLDSMLWFSFYISTLCLFPHLSILLHCLSHYVNGYKFCLHKLIKIRVTISKQESTSNFEKTLIISDKPLLIINTWMTIEVKIYIYTNMRKLILLITKTKFPNLEERSPKISRCWSVKTKIKKHTEKS